MHVFAGTERHELTSWNSFKSIFRFFNEHLQARMEEDGDEGNVEERKEERREGHKEEQREEQKEEQREEQKEEEEDDSTTVTTQKCAKHEDL